MNYRKPSQILQYTTNRNSKVYQSSAESSDSGTDTGSSNENLSQEEKYVICNTLRQEPQGQENNRHSSDSSYNTLIIHGASDDQRLLAGTPPYAYSAKHNQSTSTNLNSKEYHSGVCEITNIPDDYLSQSQVLKHLAKEVKVPYKSEIKKEKSHGRKSSKNEWSKENSAASALNQTFRSKSQPDLTRIYKINSDNQQLRHTLENSSRLRDQRCIQAMENLMQENSDLKLELEALYQKVSKSQKLEQEIINVHKAHEDLVETCERREKLEKTARAKLQNELRRLQETNRHLRDQVDIVSKQLLAARVSHSGSIDSSELSKRDALIAQLVAQNKEFLATKDRQEIELSAQRVTLEEQRTHIDILDTALTNAQANVVRLEEECRKKQMHVDRVAQLQRALTSLQGASNRREETERKLRLQLENELRQEREKNNKSQCQSNVGNVNECLPELKRKLREKDEKIMQLEGEVAKWEQRYLEESELRQAAIDAASIPKDAKIAALEKTSQESEKIIAEARSDKLRQMDEVHAAQKKVTDLESRMKELESKLAERDAMIRVLQKKHSYDKNVSTSSYPSISLTHHTPHTSLNMTDLSGDELGPASATSVLSAASSVLTSSTGFGSNTSYGGSITSGIHPRRDKYTSSNQSFDEKSLDDQLKELDSQLLSKRGLCCFPGFSHPGTLPGKRKTSKPLLASVAGANLPFIEAGTLLQGLIAGPGGSASVTNSTNRPDDIILLEKQGLISQAHRQEMARGGSLPPSSLPRPKKHRKSSMTTKFGEYGRLSDSEITSPSKTSLGVSNATRASRESTPKSFGEYSRLSEDRKTPTPTPTPPNEKTPGRESSIPLPRRFGEYRKLSDVNLRESDGCHLVRESPHRFVQGTYDYGNVTEKKLCDSGVGRSSTRESPGRSIFMKWGGDYNKLKIAENERKLSTSSTDSVMAAAKSRSSPMRSLIPSARRGEYTCFTPSSMTQATSASEQTVKIGPNVESKLRIFSPGGMPGRRGSLQRECGPKKELNEGVKSLPTPNKYRIHF